MHKEHVSESNFGGITLQSRTVEELIGVGVGLGGTVGIIEHLYSGLPHFAESVFILLQSVTEAVLTPPLHQYWINWPGMQVFGILSL
jgi:hypothetical protein